MASSKEFNGGKWTLARKKSFIISALRRASTRWGPKNVAKAKARVGHGVYLCNHCKREGAATLPPEEGKKRRRNNAAVDHIVPVVDPTVGFQSWDIYIERMFCEEEGFQVLCRECHTAETKLERDKRTKRMRDEKDQLKTAKKGDS